MRHSVHIMFGQNFAQTLQQMQIYVQKYGEGHSPYLKCMLWSADTKGNTTISTVDLQRDEKDFMVDFENRYQVSLQEVKFQAEKPESLIQHFIFLQQETINLNNQGAHSRLHYCLYFPLYDSKMWDEVKKCIAALQAGERPIEIDLFGFGYDLSKLFTENAEERDIKECKKTMHETTRQIIDLKRKPGSNLLHFIVMQNCQTNGVSLNLSHETLVKTLSEYAILCIECYDEFFGLAQPNSELQGLGLSILSLDKYYYVDYLLHKAYLFALEREGIKGVDRIDRVDVVLATNKADEILKDKVAILSEFFDVEIITRLTNKKSHDIIIQEITPLLRSKIHQLTIDCEAFITDSQWSIPVKRAVFSALLGEDDELFDNSMFNEEPQIIEDTDTESLNVYFNANNALLDTEDQKAEALLSHDGKPISLLLPEIKKQRTAIIRTSGYMRNLENEVEELETQIGNIDDSQKSLIDGEFYVFGEQRFRLLPDIQEVPLCETYAAHTPTTDSVDLRTHFTTIKNQGAQGSCTAHALTSVYEYILKSNHAENSDLSEAFLYYNARKRANEEDKDVGCRYDLAIESLVECGICEEGLMPYKPEDYTTPPSPEAFDNAVSRRVRKAVNVKCEIDDLKSALEDGYPVAVSVKLYDSFGKGVKGIVSLPAEDEMIRAEHGFHAMVLCGYSDEDRLFVVRNSWGTDFGDEGYCYIPYSYIANENLVNFAAIITEVETYSAKSIVRPESLTFGEDIKMRYAIKQNALAEGKFMLASMQAEYGKLRLHYNKLHESVLNPQHQKRLAESTELRLIHEKSRLMTEYNNARDDMGEQLDAFDTETKQRSFSKSLCFVILLMIVWLYRSVYELTEKFNDKWNDLLSSDTFWRVMLYLGVFFGIAVVVGVVLLRQQKRKKLIESQDETTKTKLSKFNARTWYHGIFIFLLCLVIAILASLSGYIHCRGNEDEWWAFWTKFFDWLYNKAQWISILTFVAGVLSVGVFILLRLKKRKTLKETLQAICDRYNERVRNKEYELEESKLRMHLAGMILAGNSIVKLNLSQKHQFMQSFFTNLNTWHTLESGSLKTINNQAEAPFISVINNDTLDEYFKQQCDELTKNISFCNIFSHNYQLTKEGIASFQTTVKQIFCKELLISIRDFSLYDYFSTTDKKRFLDTKSPKELLAELGNKSDVFIQHSKSPNTGKSIFIFTRNEAEKHNWQTISRPHLSGMPSLNKIESPLKVIMVQMEELAITDLYF